MSTNTISSKANIVFVDNFDSFTYNLVDQFRSLGHNVKIYRNHIAADVIANAVLELDNPVVVLSPGPGAPADAGCMPALIKTLRGKVPMIGICLGHQAIVEAYGGVVAGAGEIIHGKVSMMAHDNHSIYQGLPSPMAIARYHSLVATTVPDSLDITAQVNGLVMSVAHEQDRVCGFQYHPESIMTTYGATLLSNAIAWATKQL
ncbi:aminodeoxychorismate/anthranilate synthase component II [Vibrio mediterranei]|jgi:anthranilate synthase component 2|uniref:anthranilate synthase n=1 Tax=Vibrio mediterranei TaxID=689 RepID=A0AAN1KNM2_9VIBR|nr:MULTISPECIES: aminodeoxychorismate/anthranilate synthase component II [Vibrio]ASI90552.1 anthranilate synthase component II [Vibrio mediterranei]MCG9786570.1 aminodeoxychorismate/anthranilate synthase component II [Vibrio mediterranei]OIN27740.1 anthranilate synthase component II [Vibrio barjaei]